MLLTEALRVARDDWLHGQRWVDDPAAWLIAPFAAIAKFPSPWVQQTDTDPAAGQDGNLALTGQQWVNEASAIFPVVDALVKVFIAGIELLKSEGAPPAPPAQSVIDQWFDDPSMRLVDVFEAIKRFPAPFDQSRLEGSPPAPLDVDPLARWLDDPASWVDQVFQGIRSFPSASDQLRQSFSPDLTDDIDQLARWVNDFSPFTPILGAPAFDFSVLAAIVAQAQLLGAPDAARAAFEELAWTADLPWLVEVFNRIAGFMAAYDQQRLDGAPEAAAPLDLLGLRAELSVEWLQATLDAILRFTAPAYQQQLSEARLEEADWRLLATWIADAAPFFQAAAPAFQVAFMAAIVAQETMASLPETEPFSFALHRWTQDPEGWMQVFLLAVNYLSASGAGLASMTGTAAQELTAGGAGQGVSAGGSGADFNP